MINPPQQLEFTIKFVFFRETWIKKGNPSNRMELKGLTTLEDCALFEEIEMAVAGDYLTFGPGEHIFYALHCNNCPTGRHCESYAQKVNQFFKDYFKSGEAVVVSEGRKYADSFLRNAIEIRKTIRCLEDTLTEESKGLLEGMRRREELERDSQRPMDDRGLGDPYITLIDVLMVRGYTIITDRGGSL